MITFPTYLNRGSEGSIGPPLAPSPITTCHYSALEEEAKPDIKDLMADEPSLFLGHQHRLNTDAATRSTEVVIAVQI